MSSTSSLYNLLTSSSLILFSSIPSDEASIFYFIGSAYVLASA